MEQHQMHEIDCEAIVEKYGDMVYRLAVNQTKSTTEADDVFQEVFIRFIRSIDKIENEEHAKAWLIRATINCSKDVFLNAFRKNTTELVDIGFENERESEVYYAVLDLPKKYRSAIYLHYYEGYSIQEIADIMKSNPNTIKTQLSRGRELLKDKLKGEFE